MSKVLQYCAICSNYDEDDSIHENSPKHIFNVFLQRWNERRKALVKDRHGCRVNITPIQEHGVILTYFENINKGKLSLKISPIDLSSLDNTLNFNCVIKNDIKHSVHLTASKTLYPYHFVSIKDPNNNLENGKILELCAGAEYSIIVRFSCDKETLVGSYKIPVIFSFQTLDNPPQTFTILRIINISVEEPTTNNQEYLEKSPFTSNSWPKNVTVFGPKGYHNISNEYPIKPNYWKFLKLGLKYLNQMKTEDHRILDDIKKQLEPGHVTPQNYVNFWHITLWLEEVGQTLGLKQYNMENVHLKVKAGQILELEVPGLAEKRPSVIVGDFIEIMIHEDHRCYQGVIKAVNNNSVDISCVDDEFLEAISCYPTVEIDVKFVLGRLPMERMHKAVDKILSNKMLPYLFPNQNIISGPKRKSIVDYYNPLIRNNIEQQTAVVNILNATSKGAPYIVFGPPGTGKTITIVEAILQIKKKSTKNILVCAPANAACDFLTEKLLQHCSKHELIRIMSKQVDISNVHDNVLEYSNYEGAGIFRQVVPEALIQYRIVVTTLILIGKYASKYHPDIVFIDEAAQACEPEVNCAIGLLKAGNQIVLAGDPKQLGPTLCSKVAISYGLDKSLLERLMELPLYKNHDSNFITMLKLNFRSHSTILKLPNELFYDSKLKACSIDSEGDPLAQVYVFKKVQQMLGNIKNNENIYSGQAIEFCSVISKESRQGRSPSYYNQKEIIMILQYIKALTSLEFEEDEHKVQHKDIGIVTPYIRQVYKIKEILHNNNISGVDVGTTETFQGREKRVIIITTVRAQKDLLLFDKKYNLGFVRHAKRFNVALTRAMSKLIIIGCGHTLETDKNWLKYMEYCEKLGVYCGPPLIRRSQNYMDHVYLQFSKIHNVDSQYLHQTK